MKNRIETSFDAALDGLNLNGFSGGSLDVARHFFAAGARAFSTMPLCDHGVAVWADEECPKCVERGRDGESARQMAEDLDRLNTEKEAAVAAQDFERAESLRSKIGSLRLELRKTLAGPFPGYNKPFGATLPEGVSEAQIEDLRAEHEAMRRSLLGALLKAGVLDKNTVTMEAPFDAVFLVQMIGLWLQDGMPWTEQGRTHREIEFSLGRLANEFSYWRQRLVEHLSSDHDPAPRYSPPGSIAEHAYNQMSKAGMCGEAWNESRLVSYIYDLIVAFDGKRDTLDGLRQIDWEEARVGEKSWVPPVQAVVDVFARTPFRKEKDAPFAWKVFLHLADRGELGPGGTIPTDKSPKEDES